MLQISFNIKFQYENLQSNNNNNNRSRWNVFLQFDVCLHCSTASRDEYMNMIALMCMYVCMYEFPPYCFHSHLQATFQCIRSNVNKYSSYFVCVCIVCIVCRYVAQQNMTYPIQVSILCYFFLCCCFDCVFYSVVLHSHHSLGSCAFPARAYEEYECFVLCQTSVEYVFIQLTISKSQLNLNNKIDKKRRRNEMNEWVRGEIEHRFLCVLCIYNNVMKTELIVYNS